MLSLYTQLIEEFGDRLAPQVQRKATLTVLSHALEDAVIQNNLAPVVFTAFQDVRYYHFEQERYDLIRQTAKAVVVYGKGLAMSPYSLERDWFVIVNEPRFKAMLVSEQVRYENQNEHTPEIYKPYRLVWTYDAEIINRACTLLTTRTLAHDNPTQAALATIMAQPDNLESEAELLKQLGERILAELELTNLRVLQHIMRNQQLLSELEQQQAMMGQISRERATMADQQQQLQNELKQLNAEFSRTHRLMTATFIERAHHEQQRVQSSAILQQLRQVLLEWEQHTLPPAELERAAGLLDKLSTLYSTN